MLRKYPYLIASWLTILFPLCLVIGSAVADIAMSSIAILFLLHSYLTKNWQWCRESWVRCLLALWVYIVLRAIIADYQLYMTDAYAYTANPLQALQRSLPFIRYIVFAAALCYWTLADDTVRQKFFNVLTLIIFLLAADCLLQWFVGKDIIGRKVVVPKNDIRQIRLTGPFGSPIPGIILAWLSFPACLPLLMQGALKGRRTLIAGIAYCVFILSVIMLSGERMALLLTLTGWFVAILVLPGIRRMLLALLAVGIVLLGIIAATNPHILDRQVESTIHTLEYWQESPYGMLLKSDLRVAAKAPIFGIGTNYFRLECPKLYPGYDKNALDAVCNIHPHNIYLEWFIETGIIGFGLFIAFLALVIRHGIRAWPHLRKNPYFIGIVVAFAMRVWPFASSASFFSPWGAASYWLVISLFLAYSTKPTSIDQTKLL